MTEKVKTEDAVFEDVKGSEDAPFDPDNEPKNPPGKNNEKQDAMDKLLAELEEEHGEDVVEYDDEDLGAGFITKDGKYKCFIIEGDVKKMQRKNETKTKPAGSTFHMFKPVLLAQEDLDGAKVGGRLFPTIFYEPGRMRDFEHFCIATKCIAFNKDGKRKYFPQAHHEKGGSIGMPVIAEVEMKWEDKVKKNETDGKYYPVLNDDNEPVQIKRPNIVAYYPWDTDERYEAPEENVDDIDTGVSDDDLGIDGDEF